MARMVKLRIACMGVRNSCDILARNWLLAWLAFLLLALIDLLKLIKDKTKNYYPYAAGALAALAGLFTAGFFEYNFGDSEITILFLFILTIPFVAQRWTKKNKVGSSQGSS